VPGNLRALRAVDVDVDPGYVRMADAEIPQRILYALNTFNNEDGNSVAARVRVVCTARARAQTQQCGSLNVLERWEIPICSSATCVGGV
jgi:hypothetical protein